jgi:hypothetical protein
LSKFLIILTLSLFALVGVHPTALAEFQLGLEAQLVNEALNPDTANVNLGLTNTLALRGDYAWKTEAIGFDVLYTINPGSMVSLYLGLGENDVTGEETPGMTFEEKAALIAGLELKLSPGRSGPSVMFEGEINPYDLVPSGSMNELTPRVSLSFNYRFRSNLGSAADEAAYVDQDTELLAKLITLEAPEEPFEGQVAVAAVVLNRIRSNDFPDSVPDVIYQPGQFKPAPKLEKTVPGASATKAAKAALGGSDPSNGALYFYNPATCSAKARAFFKKHQVTARIGRHVFLN